MNVTLYPHQLDAVEKLDSGKILCGQVGSGKSRTALVYYILKECKGGLCINGEGEWAPMRNPTDLYILTTARKRDTLEWEAEYAALGLSSDPRGNPGGAAIHVDSWNNIGKYKDIEGAFFLFDEQRVVGRGAWVKNFLKITKKNRWILLSATPGDNWMDYVPVLIANGYYRNRTEFSERHVIYSRFAKFPKVDRYVGTKELERHRRDILIEMPFERETVQHHETVFVKHDRQRYKDILRSRWDPFKDEPVMDAGGMCYVLRRIVNEDEDRMDIVRALLAKHKRAIIFYNFDYELEKLRGLAKDIPVAEWNGHKHEKLPSGSSWAYLVQYTAGSEGWNCTTTDTVIFYSQSYSYKQMVQASGRIDRMNTPYKDLYYYHLRSTSPIDLAIQRALFQKKDFNEKRFIGDFEPRRKNN